VAFDGVTAAIVGTPSASGLIVQVPPGLTPAGTAVTVHITVTNAGGTAVSDDIFTARPGPAFAAPGSQFTPVSGTVGAQVTLSGFNFNVGTPQVRFGSVAAVVVGTPTSTTLVTQVPAGVVPTGSTQADVNITVTTSEGAVTSDDNFRAEVSIPAPVFVEPQFVPRSGIGGQIITLNGMNFNFPPVTVRFGGAVAALSGIPSATQIAVIVPPSILQPAVPITVTTAGGSVSSTELFTVNVIS
jgi:hypothetical protein